MKRALKTTIALMTIGLAIRANVQTDKLKHELQKKKDHVYGLSDIKIDGKEFLETHLKSFNDKSLSRFLDTDINLAHKDTAKVININKGLHA